MENNYKIEIGVVSVNENDELYSYVSKKMPLPISLRNILEPEKILSKLDITVKD